MNMRKFAVAALAGAATAAAAQQPFDLDLTFRTNITGNFVLSVAPHGRWNDFAFWGY
jgi:hypothetical protein